MTKTSTQIEPITAPGALDHACHLLSVGSLVAIPTETVYGLAADATSSQAVQSIFSAKGRPANNPLICHVDGRHMAERYAFVPDVAETLMRAFWPGPLTLVLPARPDTDLAAAVTAELGTIALRCPAQKDVRALIHRLGRPIAAPSANPSGRLSPTCAADVLDGLGGSVPLILDGGETEVGLESTIIAVGDRLTLLRPGSISVAEIEDATGMPVVERSPGESTITAPGQMSSHYAPRQPVILNAPEARPGHTHIGFGDTPCAINLSARGDLIEAARTLFKSLRAADALEQPITVAPIPTAGIGRAINDRLQRAAAPRPDSRDD